MLPRVCTKYSFPLTLPVSYVNIIKTTSSPQILHFFFPILTLSRWPWLFTDKDRTFTDPLAITPINHHLHPPAPSSYCSHEQSSSFLAHTSTPAHLFSSLPTPEQKMIHLPSALSHFIQVSLSTGSSTWLHKHGVWSSTLKSNTLFTTFSPFLAPHYNISPKSFLYMLSWSPLFQLSVKPPSSRLFPTIPPDLFNSVGDHLHVVNSEDLILSPYIIWQRLT